MKTLSIIVHGKVQGVFYRQSTREKAIELGLTGFVKNLPDDTVEIMVTGEPSLLDQFISWCKQGPPGARVANVVVKESVLKEFEKFQIARV
jgi:acylphosphatase